MIDYSYRSEPRIQVRSIPLSPLFQLKPETTAEEMQEHIEELEESEEFKAAWNQTLAEMEERYPEMAKQIPRYKAHFKDAFFRLGGSTGVKRLRVALEVAAQLGEDPALVLALWRREGNLKLRPLEPDRIRILLHKTEASANPGGILPGNDIKKGIRSLVLNNYIYWNTGSDVFTLYRYDRGVKDNVLVCGLTETTYKQRRSKFITTFVNMEKKRTGVDEEEELRKRAITTWNKMMKHIAYHEEPVSTDWVVVSGEVADPGGLMKNLLSLAVRFFKAEAKLEEAEGAELPEAIAYWKYNTGEKSFLRNIASALSDLRIQWFVHLTQMPKRPESPTPEQELVFQQQNEQWKHDYERIKEWEERFTPFQPLIDQYLTHWVDWIKAIRILERESTDEEQESWAREQIKAKNEWFASFDFDLLFEWIRSTSPDDTKSPLWDDPVNEESRANMMSFYFLLRAYKKFFESVRPSPPVSAESEEKTSSP